MKFIYVLPFFKSGGATIHEASPHGDLLVLAILPRQAMMDSPVVLKKEVEVIKA